MDKKLKTAAEKIMMPDELKERIIHECEHMTASTETDGHSEEFTVEQAKSGNLIRMISGIAACAVIAAGIGCTGIMLSRSDTPPSASAEIANFPVFGDISGRTLAEVSKNSSPRELTDDEIRQIAELLSSEEWREHEIPLTEIKGDLSGSNEGFTMRYYFRFTDTPPEKGCAEGFFIAEEGIFCFIEEHGPRYYDIDFEKYDRELRKILGYPERNYGENIRLEFDQVWSDRSISEDAEIKLTEFFNSQSFEPADISPEDAAEMGISFIFIGWGNDWDNGQFMILYRTGYLQFSIEPENIRMYKVSNELFLQTVGDIIAENSGVCGENAPFAEFDDPIFEVCDISEAAEPHEISYNSPELHDFFGSMYWETAEPDDDFGAGGNGIVFRASDDSSEATLTVDFDLCLAKYHVSNSNGGSSYEGEMFYKIDPQDFYYAMYRWCNEPDTDKQLCPFAGFIAGQDAMTCIIDLEKVDLDKDDFSVYEDDGDDRYLRAFIENASIVDQLSSVVEVLNDGLDWTNCRFEPYDHDNEPVFSMYSGDFHGTRNEFYSMFIYEDGTLKIQFGRENTGLGFITFRNVDGGTGELYKAIETALRKDHSRT